MTPLSMDDTRECTFVENNVRKWRYVAALYTLKYLGIHSLSAAKKLSPITWLTFYSSEYPYPQSRSNPPDMDEIPLSSFINSSCKFPLPSGRILVSMIKIFEESITACQSCLSEDYFRRLGSSRQHYIGIADSDSQRIPVRLREAEWSTKFHTP